MRFVTMFPEAENVHLIKDVGMIPYIMHKEYGLDSALACYNNCKYLYVSKEVKGLEVNFIKKYTGNSMIDGSLYLMKNSRKIDVLNLFHLRKRTLIWIVLYKILNRKGEVYLKLDANRNIKKYNFSNKVNLFCLKKCKLISIETKELYDYVNKNSSLKVQLVSNGFSNDAKIKPILLEEKENYIITVGRIGSKEKANEILLNSFAKIYNKIPDWKLKFIGPIENGFDVYAENYFKQYIGLEKQVIFTGAIYDRKELESEYRKAKIFCLTSPMEGFPLVFLEAIKNGCYIISSDVSAVYDVTCQYKYGKKFDVGDVNKLSKLLLETCDNDDKLSPIYSKIQKFAYQNYDWHVICKKINSLLK